MGGLTLTEAHLRPLQRLVTVVFFLVLLRGLLPPNGFSATVLLFDYDFGLIRRGLMGALANFWWGSEVTRGEVYAVSAAISLFGLVVLFFLVARNWLGDVLGAMLALVFFTSPAFGAMVGATGYMDLVHFGLIGLAMMTDPRRWRGAFARALAIGLAVFFHEIALGYFSVFFVAETWLRGGGAARALAPMAAALLAFAALQTWGDLPPEEVPAVLAHIEEKAAFTPDPEATVVIERRLLDNLAVMEAKRGEAGYRAWLVLDGIPLLALGLWVLWLLMRALPPEDRLGRLLAAGAMLAPWTINVIAFDVVRFGAVSVLCGLLLLAVTWEREEVRARAARALGLPMLLAVIVIGQLFSVTQLGEGEGHLWALPWVLLEQLGWF